MVRGTLGKLLYEMMTGLSSLIIIFLEERFLSLFISVFVLCVLSYMFVYTKIAIIY